jgi:hypothetical protein
LGHHSTNIANRNAVVAEHHLTENKIAATALRLMTGWCATQGRRIRANLELVDSIPLGLSARCTMRNGASKSTAQIKK